MLSSISGFSVSSPERQRSFQEITGTFSVPAISFSSATTSSINAIINNYNAALTYLVTTSQGSASRTDQNITVSGLTTNQSATINVSATGSLGLQFANSVSLLSLAETPTLTQATQTDTGGTVTITNYDAGLTYTISATAGSATRTGNTITITGLTRGQSSTLSVTASNSSGNSGTGTLVVAANPLGEFEPIATVTVPSGGLSTVSFNNIPQGYSHLQIRILASAQRSDGNPGWWGIDAYVNNNTASGTTAQHQIYGTGSAAGASGGGGTTGIRVGTVNGYSSASVSMAYSVCDILDYSSSTKNKTVLAVSGADRNGAGHVDITSSLSISTSPISALQIIIPGLTSFYQHSTISIYGYY